MTCIIVACMLFSLSAAAVIPEEAQAKIIDSENTNDGTGNYRYSFHTSNGIQRQEIGRVVNTGEENEHIKVEGSYSYTDPDGNIVLIKYTADENGYQIVDQPFIPPAAQGLSPNVVASLLG